MNAIRTRWRNCARFLLPAAAGLLAAPAVLAGATIKIDENSSVSIGGGIRASFTSTEDGAPNGTSRGNDFNLDNARLYISGRITKTLGATFNTEIRRDANNNEDGIRVMDAFVQYEPRPEFNVWFGRMLPPSDRSNLDGPFYLLAWDFPVVSQYPALAVGRDNGVTVWGKPLGGKLTYAVGAFQGHNRCTGCSNDSGKPLFAARVAYAILDPEPAPAYYTGSTYHGEKDVLTVALAGMHQKDGVGTAALKDDYNGYNVDVLFEKKLPAGVLTLEGAAYKYDFDVPDIAPAPGNIGGLVAGKGYLAAAAWLFPQAVGHGRLQPFVRYQRADPDLISVDLKVWDIGLNYIIRGHNARLAAVYSQADAGSEKIDKFLLGAQFQY